MSARAALVSLISNDPQMQLLGLTSDRVFGSNATDSPSRDGMFCVARWEEMPLQVGGLTKYTATVWFHMPREVELDYGKIDLAILRIKELARSVEHLEGEDGWVMAGMTWQGASPDLPDDGYNTLTRYATFTCACRNVS